MRALYHCIFMALFAGLALQARAATENWPVGARAAGVANSFVAVPGIWSSYHNQAGLAYLEKFSLGAYFENTYNLKQLSIQSATFAVPLFPGGVAAASFTHFGYELYSESKVGLAYAMKLGDKLAAGIQLDYFNVFITNEYGNQGAATGEIGLMYQPFENITIGVHAFNPVQAKLSGYDNEPLPVSFRTGIAWAWQERVILSAEAFADLEYQPQFRGGLEYLVFQRIYLRAGLSTQPAQNAFGLGVYYKGLRADIAFSQHPVLDYTTHIGLNYQFTL